MDMNDFPDSIPYNILMQSEDLNLKSLYVSASPEKKEPHFTAFKYRDLLGKIIYTVDY